MKNSFSNTTQRWVRVTVRLPDSYLETVSGYLFLLGAEGLSQEKEAFTAYFSADCWSPEKYALLKEFLTQAVESFRPELLEVSTLDEQDWNATWKAYFKPHRITARLVVRPPWEEYNAKADERVIIINPKMAFGTGHHESTKLLLWFMEEFMLQGKSVLDVGTGSGILSIYAVLLGAHPVVGVDIDPAAVDNARENARLNRVEDKIRFSVATLDEVETQRFDIALANINRKVLETMALAFQIHVTDTGILFLSGMVQADIPIVERVYEREGWRIVARKGLGEWRALALRRKG